MSLTKFVTSPALLHAATRAGLALLAAGLVASCSQRAPATADYSGPVADWPAFGASPGGGHYSPATQITRENVTHLVKAWEYRSGHLRKAGSNLIEYAPGQKLPGASSSWEMTPILVGDTLYGCSAFNRMFALDPATGREKWSFDPKVDDSRESIMNCRGVSSWQAAERTGARCEHRIIMGTMDARLIAVDAGDGKPCEDFGEHGQVFVGRDVGPHMEHEYNLTSPPAIVGDRIITGAFVLDRIREDSASGVVRAWDVRTGKRLWYWEALAPGMQTEVDAEGNPHFRSGTTNVWSIISVDPQRDLVFLPTGNTGTDFFGGMRKGMDQYSSSVVALRASTGELVWHFQVVHHDLWDYDVPAQPTLVDIERDGRKIPALVQPTKMGHLFILDRETGKPLFPVEERPVPQVGAVEGEYLSPTQPFPVKPAPMHPTLTADKAWGLTFWDRAACRRKLKSLLNHGIFTPPSRQGSVMFPGDYGGNNWGTPAIDPVRGLAILNSVIFPVSLQLVPRAECTAAQDLGYQAQRGTPYCLRFERVLSPLGVPCSPPPWGTLVAIDLKTGDKRWEVPLGNLEELAPWPFSRIKGSPNIGGPSVTASGLTFIAATTDRYLRAFDSETGAELWKTKLPTGGHAVPTIYRAATSQKQYVVIAAGGHYGIGEEPPGDWLIAYALPD